MRREAAYAAIKERLEDPQAFAGYVLAVLEKLMRAKRQISRMQLRLDRLENSHGLDPLPPPSEQSMRADPAAFVVPGINDAPRRKRA